MEFLCRCCESKISAEPILYFENMPKSAQYFPSTDNVKDEKGEDLSILQCPYCGLIQISGEPVSYYRDVIRATGVSQEMQQFRKKYFNEFVTKYDLYGKKVIEIGAGRGEYMKMMSLTGADVTGLENGKKAIAEGKRENYKFLKGFVESQDYVIPEAPYEAFYCMNFLEHIPYPKKFLKGIYHNLTADAVGIVEVPNLNMILDKQIFSEFIRDHLMYFTKETLTSLLENNGFEVLECKVIWYDYIISAIVRRKQPAKVTTLRHQQDKIIREINEFITLQNHLGREVAVWGAGHQALAVLSLAKLSKKIKYVIDSAYFKQDKFTPATHIPTVSPDILNQGKVGAVLIMAAGYSDEIAKAVKTFHTDIKVAILRDFGIEVR